MEQQKQRLIQEIMETSCCITTFCCYSGNTLTASREPRSMRSGVFSFTWSLSSKKIDYAQPARNACCSAAWHEFS